MSNLTGAPTQGLAGNSLLRACSQRTHHAAIFFQHNGVLKQSLEPLSRARRGRMANPIQRVLRIIAGQPRPVVPARTSKKGVGTFFFSNNSRALADLQPSWYYTWSASQDHAGSFNAPGGEFVPMIWGLDDFSNARNEGRQFSQELGRIPASATHLLGFNEPDLDSQSNIPDPIRAVDAWPRLTATGKIVGSPATSKRATRSGDWMEQFMNEAARRERTDPRYRVDFVCVHWYPDPNDNINVSDSNVGEIAAQKLERYLIDTHEKYHKRIWLTEFALIDFNHGPNDIRFPSEQGQIDFVRAAVSKLERLDFVERYAWFSLPDPNIRSGNVHLYNSSGNATSVGTAYIYAHS